MKLQSKVTGKDFDLEELIDEALDPTAYDDDDQVEQLETLLKVQQGALKRLLIVLTGNNTLDPGAFLFVLGTEPEDG
jgi:hypothetical protein